MTEIPLEGHDDLLLSLDEYSGGGASIRIRGCDWEREMFGAEVHIPAHARDEVAEFLRTD